MKSTISSWRRQYQALPDPAKQRIRRWVTVGWLIVLGALAIWVLTNERENLRDVWHHLKTADRKWLAVIPIAEICSILSVSWTFKLTLRRLGHPVSIPYLFNLHLQRAGVNFAAPLGGALTPFVFADRLERKNVPPEDAILTLAIRTASVWGATLIVLVLTAGLSGKPVLIAGSVAALVAATLLTIFIGRSGRGNWRTPQRWARKLPAKQSTRVLAAIERFKAHDLDPSDLLASIGTTLLTRTATITLIYASVRALGAQPEIADVFLAYVVSFVAGRLVPFFYGMGAVEGSLSLALERGGVPIDIALGTALLFRLVDFLIPSLIGLVLYAWAEHHDPSSAVEKARRAAEIEAAAAATRELEESISREVGSPAGM
jgi:uncharacterized protein (TIRG00374 family)